MVSRVNYISNLELVERFSAIKGAIVECGTWKGGMIAGMATILGHRNYVLFDSFEGLPPVADVDGQAAKQWQQDKTSPKYYDNCKASVEDAVAAMDLAGKQADIRKGWFEDALPKAEFSHGIAILRMDADWYESTMDILDNLFDQVVPGGVVIVDDYYTWEGCSKAVHDYLARNKRPERIRSHKGVCYIVKL